MPIQSLVDAINLLNCVRVTGREDMARMLAAMQKIEDAAKLIAEKEGVK